MTDVASAVNGAGASISPAANEPAPRPAPTAMTPAAMAPQRSNRVLPTSCIRIASSVGGSYLRILSLSVLRYQPSTRSWHKVTDGESAGWLRHGALRCDRVEEGRGSVGQSAGESQCAAMCSRDNRKQTASASDLSETEVRVKRCGKSAPASEATPAARLPPLGARSSRKWAARPILPGRPHRWIVTQGRQRPGQNPAYRLTHRQSSTLINTSAAEQAAPMPINVADALAVS